MLVREEREEEEEGEKMKFFGLVMKVESEQREGIRRENLLSAFRFWKKRAFPKTSSTTTSSCVCMCMLMMVGRERKGRERKRPNNFSSYE